LDTWRALGFVHAQERGWQLEFNRRLMRGELSEILGAATLDTDKLMRTLGIIGMAQKQLMGLSPATQAALQAYSEGIQNAWAKWRGAAIARIQTAWHRGRTAPKARFGRPKTAWAGR
jgi:acyl-homoserine lactone acylase PvdQ